MTNVTGAGDSHTLRMVRMFAIDGPDAERMTRSEQ
jgi:hypothetical protein